MNATIIVSAGSGKRMKSDKNKQFIMLDGIPVIIRTLQTFDNVPEIDYIVVVTRNDDIETVNQLISEYKISKRILIVSGGDTRQQSVYNGINALKESNLHIKNVLIHDGARPFVSEKNIKSVLDQLETNCMAAAVGVKIKDTIKQINLDSYIEKTLDRDTLISIQTPQGFDFRLIASAHKKAIEYNINVTDDCALIEELTNEAIKVIIGDYNNIKITTPEDITLGENILRQLKQISTPT